MSHPINRAIALLESGQPIYYVGGHTGHVLTHEQGKQDTHTWADYINVGMEHGAFDMAGLDKYMRGLVDGGPTGSGHRTPTVIVELPVDGSHELVVRYNAWQYRQILARGVHGVLLCQAESADAVRAFVESCRYPIHKVGVGRGLGIGTRGRGSEPAAAWVWGLSPEDYLLLTSDSYALSAGESTGVPGWLSSPTQIMVTQRQGADALARDRKDGIAHRRENRRDTRLADATPLVTAAQRQVRLDLGHGSEAEHLVGIEITFGDAALVDAALTIEQR